MREIQGRIAALLERSELSEAVRGELEALRAALGPAEEASLNTVLAVPASGSAQVVRGGWAGSAPGRYREVTLLGTGGMGEVHRVQDAALNRAVARKVVRPELQGDERILARFLQEAQTTAQLEHPGIVPVYDLGALEDGRAFFTMKEVRGRTLGSVIREVHGGWEDGRFAPVPSGWTFRRMVDALHRVCDAVGYAHARGVVHRDLKPENIMLGEFGEVLVVDWGLARVLGRRDFAAEAGELDVVTTTVVDAEGLSEGAVEGTPAYMSPEQAHGRVGAIDARSDVYALGAILYEILSGRPPYLGRDPRSVLRQVLEGPPLPVGRAPESLRRHESLQFGTTRLAMPEPEELEADTEALDREALAAQIDASHVPEELLETCQQAMAREPSERYADARELAAEIAAWLDGARRRERALEVLQQALARAPEAQAMRAQAEVLRQQARAQLGGVPLWAAEAVKAASWSQEDSAEALEQAATLRELEAESLLRAALTHAPELAEAHAALAERYSAEHAEAEARHDATAARRAEARLREHVWAMPERSAERRRHLDYLQGDGRLTLITDPPGARVQLHRFQMRNRRLVASFERTLGVTPLKEVRLPMGSYLLEIEHPERATVRYPVRIGRREHWDGVRPGGAAPHPIYLPQRAELGADDVYVPAGWVECGDGQAPEALPQQRVWVDGFVLQRFPVTNARYIAFLNALVDRGEEAAVQAWAPRERAGTIERQGAMIYGRDAAGHLTLQTDSDGVLWEPDWPVMLVDGPSAAAYASWLGEQTGQPWRLPGELEWEKGARGVDARVFPWGSWMDPSWCCIRDSHAGRQLPVAVDTFPVDASPYGVRGMAGNVRDWCLDLFRKAGPPCPAQIAARPAPLTAAQLASPETLLVTRGGGWFNQAPHARAAARGSYPPQYRLHNLGFRVARSFPEPP